MKWFAVKCIYEIICGDGKHAPQFNEQIRLIVAENINEVLVKVRSQAKNYNSSFKNCDGAMVVWKFINVGSIVEIDEPADGIEVNSKILEPKSVKLYLEKVKHRNKILTETNL